MEVVLEIEVLPEGSLVHRHTSLLLDLRNRAHVLRFLNTIVDETPIIPYEVKMEQECRVGGAVDEGVLVIPLDRK